MDLSTQRLMMGAAGSAAPAYVEDVFSTWLYTGNGSTQTITNGIDLSGKGGLVWTKARTTGGSSMYGGTTGSNALYSTDMAFSRLLSSNQTNGLINDTPGGITAVSFTGFTTAYDGAFNEFNASGVNYASWTFRKAAKFFDVVTWVGNGVNNRQISHSLGSEPGFIIVKPTSATGSWICYHRSLGTGNYLVLQSTQASNNVAQCYPTVTSSYFIPTSDTNAFAGNDNGVSYVAYLFAHDAGGFGDSGNDSVVKCGTYNNGSAGSVDLGWEPQWVLTKASSGTGNWVIFDSMRGMPVSGSGRALFANSSSAELDSSVIRPTSTGFTYTSNANADDNIYIAIRRGPMKTPTDATKVFSTSTYTGTSPSDQTVTAGFPVDLIIGALRDQAHSNDVVDRIRGRSQYLYTTLTNAEASSSSTQDITRLDVQDGYVMGDDWNSNFNTNTKSGINWNFRRAPGFFDVVGYSGNDVNRTISHNLGVAPELMIVKRRDNAASDWQVYAGAADKYLVLNTTAAYVTANTRWNDTAPTSTVFTVGTSSGVNGSGNNYIAYLFATCPGVSKVGSYTGTGTTLQVNCGFTSGARFVLIKRTDSTGDWYVWDSARGIVAGNDPYLLLNSTAAEVTGTDYVDTYSAGFEISSTAPAAINANGGSFIFLAVS